MNLFQASLYESDSDLVRTFDTPNVGDHFYMTEDGAYFLTAIDAKELKFLTEHVLLPYYENAEKDRNSLFAPYCGLYVYKKLNLLITRNLLPQGVMPHQQFALKGSTVGRKVYKNLQNNFFVNFLSYFMPNSRRQKGRPGAQSQHLKIQTSKHINRMDFPYISMCTIQS